MADCASLCPHSCIFPLMSAVYVGLVYFSAFSVGSLIGHFTYFAHQRGRRCKKRITEECVRTLCCTDALVRRYCPRLPSLFWWIRNAIDWVGYKFRWLCCVAPCRCSRYLYHKCFSHNQNGPDRHMVLEWVEEWYRSNCLQCSCLSILWICLCLFSGFGFGLTILGYCFDECVYKGTMETHVDRCIWSIEDSICPCYGCLFCLCGPPIPRTRISRVTQFVSSSRPGPVPVPDNNVIELNVIDNRNPPHQFPVFEESITLPNQIPYRNPRVNEGNAQARADEHLQRPAALPEASWIPQAPLFFSSQMANVSQEEINRQVAYYNQASRELDPVHKSPPTPPYAPTNSSSATSSGYSSVPFGSVPEDQDVRHRGPILAQDDVVATAKRHAD